MSTEEPRKSFLQTGTGMLTAAATFIAAVAALLTALSQLGGDGGDGPSSGPPGATTVAATTSTVDDVTESELRSGIPAPIRGTCRTADNGEGGAVAALNCTYRKLVGVQYNLFPSSTEMQSAYGVVRKRYGFPAGADAGRSCRAGNFEGGYRREGGVAGRLLCFIDDGDRVAAIVWTDDDVLSFTWRDDRNLGALYDAWLKDVGPLAG